MMRFKKQFRFLFSFLFKIPAILSPQEKIKQKCLSAVLFLLSLFSFLCFSLTWVKVSKPSDWSVWQCSFNRFNYGWNRTFTVSLFFQIHITFQHLRIVEGKRFELYLSFQISFSLFYRWVSFPELVDFSNLVLKLASSKLKFSFKFL